MIKIKDFSKQTGFSIRMLRYLEEVGVLIPSRDSNNYRVFNDEQISEALWIKKLQNLGFQLKEIECLKTEDFKEHNIILKNVLAREQQIAEIKSETIPMLRLIADYINRSESTIQEYYKNEVKTKKMVRTLGGENKFHRTAYSIPILRNIYEDHLTNDANIVLIATDLLKFSEWVENCTFIPDVYSAFQESAFIFGHNLNEHFINGYELSWKKFLPAVGLKQQDDFSKEDVVQLMGPHDIIIRSTFKYKDSDIEGEIIIPYTPVYTMSQLGK